MLMCKRQGLNGDQWKNHPVPFFAVTNLLIAETVVSMMIAVAVNDISTRRINLNIQLKDEIWKDNE
jgi:hypothetical protein